MSETDLDPCIVGQDTVIPITVTRAGTAVPLTGGTLTYTAKRSLSDDAVFTYSGDGDADDSIVFATQSGAGIGSATLTIPGSATVGFAETTVLSYDLRLIEAAGTTFVAYGDHHFIRTT